MTFIALICLQQLKWLFWVSRHDIAQYITNDFLFVF